MLLRTYLPSWLQWSSLLLLKGGGGCRLPRAEQYSGNAPQHFGHLGSLELRSFPHCSLQHVVLRLSASGLCAISLISVARTLIPGLVACDPRLWLNCVVAAASLCCALHALVWRAQRDLRLMTLGATLALQARRGSGGCYQDNCGFSRKWTVISGSPIACVRSSAALGGSCDPLAWHCAW